MAIIYCPFYKEHKLDTIVCEKLKGTEEERENHFFLDRKGHMKACCNHVKHWERCEHAAKLISKYGGKDGPEPIRTWKV